MMVHKMFVWKVPHWILRNIN